MLYLPTINITVKRLNISVMYLSTFDGFAILNLKKIYSMNNLDITYRLWCKRSNFEVTCIKVIKSAFE